MPSKFKDWIKSMDKKKQKTYHFHNEWKELYFFTMYRDNCLCLICRATVALAKKGNLERHFSSLHKNYENEYPVNSELRKRKVKELKGQLAAQQLLFHSITQQSKLATEASYAISYVLAKHKKPYQDGEIFKEAFLEASEKLFCNFKNKNEILNAIKDLQLSRRTVTRRIEDMNENVIQQLEEDIYSCSFFSLQFDESTDAVDTAQLIVFIRMIFSDISIKEEFLTILPMKETIRGEDIFTTFVTFTKKTKLPLHKLVSISTDGAPCMVGRKNGFLALCRQNEQFPDFISFHCIIHNNVLCAKVLDVNDVMDVAVKIANSIRARSLRTRLFRNQLEENDSEYEDLVLFSNVRWLSRGCFLERFLELLPEIVEFLNLLGEKHRQLEDPLWVQKLAFLTDFICHYNSLNLELQGKGKNIIQLNGLVLLKNQSLSLIVTGIVLRPFDGICGLPYLLLVDKFRRRNCGYKTGSRTLTATPSSLS
nr:general transcription factor II-I repeat domain-containing protein 2A-like [Onthophagus taurus]